MENVWLITVVVSFLIYIFLSKYYENKNQNKENIILIRELTTSIKSSSLWEYSSSLPEYEEKKEEKEVIKDELVEIDQVEPEQLLRAISK